MPFRIPHSASRIRNGHTLVELVVATVSGSVLLAALASTTYIATQVAYTPLHAQKVLDGTKVVFDLEEELQHAIHIVDHGPRHIEFVTEDRNGDNVEDTFRYAWSGTVGAPLTKSVNRGTPVNVIDSLASLSLEYTTQEHDSILKVTTAGAEQQLESSHTATSYGELKLDQHFAHRLDLSSLPASTTTWSLSRISFYADDYGGSGGEEEEDGGESPGEFAVQLRRAATDGLPTSEVIAEWIVPESTLSGWGWYSVAPIRPIEGLSPYGHYCVVLQWRSGTVAARVGTHSDTGGMIQSVDNGATWQVSSSSGLMVRVDAIPHALDQPLTFRRDRLSIAHISLQCGDNGLSRIDTSVTLKNAPALVQKVWQTDFEADPTAQDRNGDGNGDFDWSGGATFDMSTIREGVWQTSGYLWAEHTSDVTTPIVVELCGESIGSGGYGLSARAVVGLGAAEHADVTGSLVLEGDGTQTARLLAYDGTTTLTLTTVRRLPARPLDLRIVIEPIRRLAALEVAGVDYPVVSLPIVGSGVATDRFYITEDSSHAEHDYVSFQVTKP